MTRDGKDVTSIRINGTDRDPKGLARFVEPEIETPYWHFEFEDGRFIVATGDVEVVYTKTGGGK